MESPRPRAATAAPPQRRARDGDAQLSGACTVCGIVRGEVEASIVRADGLTLAFMDISQSGLGGHVLVIPRAHVEDIFSLDRDLAASLMQAIRKVASAVRASFAPDGMNIFQSNGEAAGQEVPHVHFHVQPRWLDDGMLRVYSSPTHPPRRDLDEMARRVAAALHPACT